MAVVEKNLRRTANNFKLNEGQHTGVLQLVSTGLDGGYAMWNADGSDGGQLNNVRYGSDGSIIGGLHTAEAAMSDCQPIVWNGKVVWYATDNSKPVFYFLNESGVSENAVQ